MDLKAWGESAAGALGEMLLHIADGKKPFL